MCKLAVNGQNVIYCVWFKENFPTLFKMLIPGNVQISPVFLNYFSIWQTQVFLSELLHYDRGLNALVLSINIVDIGFYPEGSRFLPRLCWV